MAFELKASTRLGELDMTKDDLKVRRGEYMDNSNTP